MIRQMVVVAVAILAAWSFPAEAAKAASAKKAPARQSPAKKAASKKTTASPAPSTSAFRRDPYVGAVAVDAESGKVLFSDRADQKAYPASVTKLMTVFLVLEDVRAGRYTLDQEVTATPDVNRCEPSWVGLKVGDKMTVRDLCTALMVESANDAAIALGVHASGSLAAFVARMNQRAAALGMVSTQYYNPNGLPAPKYGAKFNCTTAADQVKLARALSRLPEIYHFTSVKTCDLVKTPVGYRVFVTRRANEPNRTTVAPPGCTVIKQMRNHNNVMVKDKLKIFNPDGKEAVDGLKTGYINAGGSSVVLSGRRNGRHAIVVVLGSASAALRDDAARRLMMDALDAIGTW